MHQEPQRFQAQAQVAAIDATAAGDAIAEAVATEGAGAVSVAASPVRRLLTSPVVVTFLFLVVTMLAFSVLAPGKFGTSSNIMQLAQNTAILLANYKGRPFMTPFYEVYKICSIFQADFNANHCMLIDKHSDTRTHVSLNHT